MQLKQKLSFYVRQRNKQTALEASRSSFKDWIKQALDDPFVSLPPVAIYHAHYIYDQYLNILSYSILLVEACLH